MAQPYTRGVGGAGSRAGADLDAHAAQEMSIVCAQRLETQVVGGAPHVLNPWIPNPWLMGPNVEGPGLPLPTRRLPEAADTSPWVGGDSFKEQKQ